MNWLQLYLLLINAVTFVVFTIDYRRFRAFVANSNKKIRRYKDVQGYGINEDAMRLLTIFGGALGACVAYLVWDRHINKQNIGERLHAFLLLVVQSIVYLCLEGPDPLRLDLVGMAQCFYESHQILCWYLLVISVITFLAFYIDKRISKGDGARIPEVVLLGLCLAGGTLGGYVSMYWFQHKYTRYEFYLGIPMIAITQIIVCAYLCAIGVLS